MKRANLPSEAVADSELERIKAHIRGERFVLFDKWWWVRWLTLLGIPVGVAVCLWRFMSDLYHYQTTNLTIASRPITSIIEIAFWWLVLGVVLGAAGGFALGMFIFALFTVFRPVYVALRYSPEEFEREYGDHPPQKR